MRRRGREVIVCVQPGGGHAITVTVTSWCRKGRVHTQRVRDAYTASDVGGTGASPAAHPGRLAGASARNTVTTLHGIVLVLRGARVRCLSYAANLKQACTVHPFSLAPGIGARLS